MRYVKPMYYDKFACIADRCPASCCQGWQIVIDDSSLERYWNENGSFANRLKNSIDWESGTFCQYKGRCEFLNEKNLCDIQETLGEESLCDTCRNYPRHVEEFEGVREYSLSLSCPEAARLMLTEQSLVTLTEWETTEEETFEEGFDFLLYTQLLDARKILWRILQDRETNMWIRLEACCLFSEKIQVSLDQDEYFGIDEWIRLHERDFRMDYKLAEKYRKEKDERNWEQKQKEIQALKELERLDPSWNNLLEEAEDILYKKGKDEYEKLCTDFQIQYGYNSFWQEKWMIVAEQLAIFFLYTYFCGAVYDWEVNEKVYLMIFSVEWIQELTMCQWYKEGKILNQDAVITMAYRFAREIEHSDQNLLCLEQWLKENYGNKQPDLRKE